MSPVRSTVVALALVGAACAPSAPETPAAAAGPPATARVPAAEPVDETVVEPVAPSAEPPPSEPLPSDRECDTGDGCHAVAVQEERARRYARAVELYVRACDRGSARSCHQAGELLSEGTGVAVDDVRARELFEQGCQRGSTAACDALGH